MSAAGPKLILVKHAMPVLVEGRPPSSWLLSEDGRRSCVKLAERLREHAPDVIVTSTEPKANETGLLVAEALAIPFETAPDLHEARRETVRLVDDPVAWLDAIERFFKHPGELVLGEETAHQAGERFAAAVQSVLNLYPDETVAIVCHGTVISLYAARVAGVTPFSLWQRLGLPSFVVMSRPDMEILEVVEGVG